MIQLKRETTNSINKPPRHSGEAADLGGGGGGEVPRSRRIHGQGMW